MAQVAEYPPTRMSTPLWKRLLRWILILVVVLAIADLVVFPVVMGVIATRPAQGSVGEPPAGFEAIPLTTDDGVRLGAWYSKPENGAAILVVHGASGSRDDMRERAEMLAAHGFGVLMLDLRGHGESEGAANLLGWMGSSDVGAAIAFLEQQPDVVSIGALGNSLGGEVLLGAAASYPLVRAIVSDGATYRSREEYRALPAHRGPLEWVHFGVMDATVRLLSGQAPPSPLLDSMLSAADTDFLLIAAGNDAREVEFNTYFVAAVGERGSLWVAEDVSHTGAFARYPQEYEARVVTFFQDSLF